MSTNSYQYIVVGSGAGGATVARELSKRGKSVLVIEQGNREEKLGSFFDALRFYDNTRITHIPKKSKEGVILWRAFMAGGTTVASMANGVRCLEKELALHGINLQDEFVETEQELGVAAIPDDLISPGGKRIRDAARSLGYQMENMPKFLDAEKCKNCGNCSLGCSTDAKWSALKYLEEAQQFGAQVMLQTAVQKVTGQNGRVTGVIISGQNGQTEIRAENVILAAGGLGTPVILQKSGVDEAGSNLFIDIIVNTYGVTDDFNLLAEPQMALVDLEFHADRGFLLSTSIQHPREVRLIEMGLGGAAMPVNRLVGMMTKIADEPSGRVFADGSVSKTVTRADQQKLDEGTRISTEILVKAGAKPASIRYSVPQGAHPGGTAAIGKVVDGRLMTEIQNLYVCDASVLPQAPGLPPILTLVALGKWLAKELVK
jgi:choline dehydrogenase-like flavoprotein